MATKSLKDFRVSFKYGATSAPYSKARPHRGNDRAAPMGTPIVIEGVTIGYVGASGLATGPHCHTQAGTDEWCQKTIKPDAYEFKPGKVVHVGYGSQWGNYVTVKVGTRYICYAHLSRTKAKVGQVIKPRVVYKTATAIRAANVRKAPKLSAPLSGVKTLKKGDKFQYTKIVTGQSVNGHNKWHKSRAGNYVWSRNVKG